MKKPRCFDIVEIIGNCLKIIKMKKGEENMKNLIEVLEYTGIGYQPIMVCRDFRVAVLNYHQELLPENINNFQKHSLTDEAFVLLKGHCILFVAEDESLEKIHAVELEPYKTYNVKKGTYHTHTLTEDAMVLIVEADDTCDDNSPIVRPDAEVTGRLIEMTKEIENKRKE